jgi:hypothetical protein
MSIVTAAGLACNTYVRFALSTLSHMIPVIMDRAASEVLMIPVIMANPCPLCRDNDLRIMITRKGDGQIMITAGDRP